MSRLIAVGLLLGGCNLVFPLRDRPPSDALDASFDSATVYAVGPEN